MQKSYFNLSPKETLEQLGVTSGGLDRAQAVLDRIKNGEKE